MIVEKQCANFSGNESFHWSLLSFLLVIFAYGFILFFAIRPDVSWVHPEIQLIDNFVIHADRRWYELIFNWEKLEFAPRHTRALSSLVQIIDSKLRLALPPSIYLYSQSWSVTWVFSIFVNPYLFYKLLRIFVKTRYYCYLGLALYLLSSTSLSSIVMFFRPAKVLAQFFLLYSLLLSAQIARDNSNSLSAYGKLALIVFLGMLSDEAGWFVIPMVFLFHLFFDRERLAKISIALLFSAALACCIYFLVMPAISTYLWGNNQQLGDYFILKNILQSNTPLDTVIVLLLEWVNGTITHFQVFIRDVLSLFPLNSQSSLMWRITYVVSGTATLAWMAFGLASIFIKSEAQFRRYLAWTGTGFVLGIFFHSLLMTVVGNKIFGPFYYGGFITPFLIIIYLLISKSGIAFISATGHRSQPFFVATTFLTALTLSHTFLATNIAIKNVHYYPPASTAYREIFSNVENRFDIEPVFSDQKKQIHELLSLSGGCVDLPVELLWLATKLKLVSGAGFPPGDKTVKVCR